ncbi:hypothetical protein SSS_04321 [Sarcoptes scabiei]|uniref:Uncharacterized protein n=1 Tax=Sarcoptes scabiei TaxID=52283 RepID=A0A834RBV1_SARSC|nr:hypothetical protein SSS_04321 [Sarcoptes scabiei]UXI21269.1 abnormal spindle-like microcephaly-associated protein [Sarcoptes scabiei]
MDDVSGADNHHPKQQSSTSASIPSSSQFFDPQQQQQQQMAQNLGPEMKVVIVDEFLNTGRTGRRNALGDILDENTAHLSTSALPDQLSSLTFSNDQSTSSNPICQQPSTSSSPAPSTSSSTSQT